MADTYHGYHAEEAVRKALTERYPRGDFLLATKMPLRDFRNEQDMEVIFREQLEHCGVKFFDCYLLHNMGYNVYAKCLEIANKYHWAMRFAASQEGVSRVLSGMNDMTQVEGNARTFAEFEPLDKKEYEIIWQAAEIINSRTEISCTGCGYCTHGCPKDIAIPQYFSLYNNVMQMDGNASSHNAYYFNLAAGHGKCSDCIMCGQCEKACPQKLPIRSYLKNVAWKYESEAAFPVRK